MFNWYFLLAFAGVVVASLSQVLLKKSAMKDYNSVIREYLNGYVIGGYGMMFLSMFLMIMAYRGIDYMNGPVIESLGYVLVMGLSFFFFSEKISKRKVLGTLFILAGIAVYYL